MAKYWKYAKEIVKKNYSLFLITTFIISITIILTTSSLYTFIMANKFSAYLKHSPKISILFDAKTSATELQDFINKYKKNPAVQKIYQKPPSEVIQEYTPSDYTINDDELVKIIRIDLNPTVDASNLVKQIYNEQQSNENIIEVIYLPELYNKLKVISNWINIISIVILMTFATISMVLIYSTLRLGLEKIESEIRIMKNIGAPKRFIQVPLLITTGSMILIGGGIGILIAVLGYYASLYTLKASDMYSIIRSLITSLDSQRIFHTSTLVGLMSFETIALLLISIAFTKIIINQFLITRKNNELSK